MFEKQLKKLVDHSPVPTCQNVNSIFNKFADDINKSAQPVNQQESVRKMFLKLLTKYRQKTFVGPIRPKSKLTMVVKKYKANVVYLD